MGKLTKAHAQILFPAAKTLNLIITKSACLQWFERMWMIPGPLFGRIHICQNSQINDLQQIMLLQIAQKFKSS